MSGITVELNKKDIMKWASAMAKINKEKKGFVTLDRIAPEAVALAVKEKIKKKTNIEDKTLTVIVNDGKGKVDEVFAPSLLSIEVYDMPLELAAEVTAQYIEEAGKVEIDTADADSMAIALVLLYKMKKSNL